MNKFQTPGKSKLINGTILLPEASGLRLILSFNNMVGDVKGNDLLPIFDKKWKRVKEDFKMSYINKNGSYKLGTVVASTTVQSDVWVQHLLVQDENLNVDLSALNKTLKQIQLTAKTEKASVHVSTILTTKVPELTKLLKEYLLDEGINVYFYEENQ